MAEELAGNGQKKKKAFMIVGVIVVIGLIAGYLYSGYRKTHVSTDDAFIDGNIHTISARISGTVKSLYVNSNQQVKKDDLLVDLDPQDYRSRSEAARANLELQRAILRQAERELKRAKALFESKTNSADRYDKAVSTQEIAVSQVKLAEEQLRQAELNLSYTVLRAPADGYATKIAILTGNHIQAGQLLMAIVSLENLTVVANYKETELGRIRPGQEVRLKVDAYPDKVFTGKVDSIMAGTGVSFSLFPAENATGNYVKVVQRIPIKIVLDPGADKDHVLRIGMSVEPTVLAK
ncbi:MAG: HlyD family secretion protein [Nitrospirae bacterium]|nr:HlyD family secretion protein [Nitrospirota bacterium]